MGQKTLKNVIFLDEIIKSIILRIVTFFYYWLTDYEYD